jgi:hypothetical protein
VPLPVEQDGIARLEALFGKVRDDAALQLTADAVGRKDLRDNQQVVRGRLRRRRGRRGCLCGLRRL